jgi:ceramide synthetase
VNEVAKSSNLTVKEVNHELWARRRNSSAQKKLTKFIEAAWRFMFYSAFVYVGITSLLYPERKAWMKDTKENWSGWPMQQVDSGVYFYYLVELGAYLHQLAWTEVSRSDSFEMITHHFVTIFLIVLSYCSNFTRVGSTVLILHDSADVFLELAKCFNYISKVKGKEWASMITDSLFGVFTITFFITRLVLYPRYVYYSSYIEAEEMWGKQWPGFWVYFCLLGALQILHIFWFYTICRMIVKLMTTGIQKDERSDDEDEDDEDDKIHQDNKSTNNSKSKVQSKDIKKNK